MNSYRKERRPIQASLVHRTFDPADPKDDAHPAVLLLHGRGSDELDLLELADGLDPRLTVISARAPFTLGPGYQWYEFQGASTPDPGLFADSFQRLSTFIDEIVSGYSLRHDQLYVLGFSQGAMMAGSIALLNPDRVGGAVVLSGYLPSSVHARADLVRGKPFFVGHGVRDSVLPVEFGRRARDLLERVGVDLTYKEYPIEHYIDYAELQDVATWLTSRIEAR